MDVSYLMKDRSWSAKALQNFGFQKQDRAYRITVNLADTGLQIRLTVSDGSFTATVYDPDLDEVYAPFDATAYMGGFVEMVRNKGVDFTKHVVEVCSISTEDQKRGHREWLFPSNLKYYNLVSVLKHTDYQTWHYRVDIRVGDFVYMYITAPTAAILYKCVVTDIGLPPDEKGRKRFRMKRLLTYPRDVFTVDFMRQCGSGPVRSERSVPPALSERLKEYEKTLMTK